VTVLSRADLHMHTTCSDGLHSPARLALQLARSRLAVAAVTDHDTIEGALRVEEALDGAEPEIVIGSEVSSAEGHVLALYISRDVPPGMSAEATAAAIHDQGGLAVAAHPYSLALGVGDLACRLDFDAIEMLNGAPLMELSNLRAARRLSRTRVAHLGGSDAHVAWAAGRTFTVFAGSGAADLRAAILAGETRPATDWPGHLSALPAHMAWHTWLPIRARFEPAQTPSPSPPAGEVR
jgi:predicted metal-dependent phosphoesterase TrpH